MAPARASGETNSAKLGLTDRHNRLPLKCTQAIFSILNGNSNMTAGRPLGTNVISAAISGSERDIAVHPRRVHIFFAVRIPLQFVWENVIDLRPAGDRTRVHERERRRRALQYDALNKTAALVGRATLRRNDWENCL